MELIDKSALVAEIETLYNENYKFLPSDIVESVDDFKDDLLTVLDRQSTVKEVDLNKELNDFIEEQKAWVKDDKVVEYNNGDSFNHIYDLEFVAKHFFELGLKVQKGE
jgi:hypothetical protein